MSHKNHPIFATVILVAVLLISSLSGCKKPEATERETIRVFSQLLPENDLFYSEDGGIWGYSNRVHGNEGEPEQRAAVRYGPVFLPETEDVGDTLRLHITGIRKTEPLGSSNRTIGQQEQGRDPFSADQAGRQMVSSALRRSDPGIYP